VKGLDRRIFKAFILITLAFTVFSLAIQSLRFEAHGSDEAASAIENADKLLRQAFESVLEAERAGANVSSLIGRLNEAAMLLAEAETAYRTGNSTEALTKAEKCSTLLNGVEYEALRLKSSAKASAKEALLQASAFSSLGIVLFLTVLFLVWTRFKRAYLKKLMKMKPEAAS